LGYQRFGAASGPTVLFFHGSPGSRLGAALLDTAATQRGLRLIGVDRPGMGGSDRQPGRRLSDWPHDIALLLDHLELHEVAVLGVSAGAAYVYACCWSLLTRVSAAAVISGVGPPWALTGIRPATMRFILRRLPAVGRLMFSGMLDRVRREPETFIPPGCGPADRRALDAPGIRVAYRTALLEAFAPGVEGVLDDQRLQLLDWGIDLRAISTPIHLWHGKDDRVVSPAVARRVARVLAAATLTILPGAGHFSAMI